MVSSECKRPRMDMGYEENFGSVSNTDEIHTAKGINHLYSKSQ